MHYPELGYYYGSDFQYMIHLLDELMSAGRCKMDTILNGVFGTFDGATEDGYKQINILRMDDFVVKVHLQYENEVCDTRDAEIGPLDYEPSWFQKLVEEDVKVFGGKHTLNPTRKK